MVDRPISSSSPTSPFIERYGVRMIRPPIQSQDTSRRSTTCAILSPPCLLWPGFCKSLTGRQDEGIASCTCWYNVVSISCGQNIFSGQNNQCSIQSLREVVIKHVSRAQVKIRKTGLRNRLTIELLVLASPARIIYLDLFVSSAVEPAFCRLASIGMCYVRWPRITPIDCLALSMPSPA